MSKSAETFAYEAHGYWPASSVPTSFIGGVQRWGQGVHHGKRRRHFTEKSARKEKPVIFFCLERKTRYFLPRKILFFRMERKLRFFFPCRVIEKRLPIFFSDLSCSQNFRRFGYFRTIEKRMGRYNCSGLHECLLHQAGQRS